jgi:F5/8 type C domain/Abnormal spindle-like microcephaly-assoc'd, ASPM-SPD-2-Hydin
VLNAATAQATIGAIAASSDFAQTNNCGTSLGTDSSCTINVTFTPTGPGVTTGSLTIPSNEPGSPATVTLVGTSGGSTTGNNVLTVSPSSLSFGDQTVGGTTSAQSVTVSNPVGSATATISSIAVSGQFSQTNNCGSSLAAGSSCTVSVEFAPTSGGSATGALSITNSTTATPLSVSLTGTGVTSTTNLALGATMTASGSTQNYVPSNANDGNPDTYWESTDNAFPQWLEANLGSAQTIGSITLDLPPLSDWPTRTQTLSVLGSNNGSTWTTLVASAGYTFNSAAGNTVTISLPATVTEQYLQLDFTANTGWPAGQVSEFEIFSGGAGSPDQGHR